MRRARGSLVVAICLGALGLLLPALSRAQLSPGELSRAHAELEGSGNCLSCHQAQRGVDPPLCLSCHESLAKRIESELGLHAQAGYERCERCHIEHHGRDFDLIWWGEEGRDSFDHGLTGFALEGAHAGKQCAECHRPESIVDRTALEAAGKDLETTFLGLDRACLSCHRDEHLGQVAADSCASCHDFGAWNPASAFDHAQADFALTGLHQSVACAGCHGAIQAERDGEPVSTMRFEVGAFGRCSDCHRDPHDGRLGPSCESCHSTAGWSRFDRGAFDHGDTRFLLTGAHLRVSCDLCHAPGTGFRIESFERCVDCHEDEHLGQLSRAAAEGCTWCHTTDTFTPATFTLDDHQRSSYPLAGAHLAIPCIACHQEIDLGELRSSHFATLGSPGKPRVSTRQFRFGGTACEDCHGDPHLGELDRWREDGGCEACHELASWRSVSFDHDLTELPLRGRHAALRCADCHLDESAASASGPMPLTVASAECASCHEDPHLDQFADAGASCATCHQEEGWTDLLFDHDRDARFALEGAHLKLDCGACHPVETRAGQAFIRYRPLAYTCEACHATYPPGQR